MGDEHKYKILLIDDNPFPTRECCIELIKHFCEYFNTPSLHEHLNQLYKTYSKSYPDLANSYLNVRGKSETFSFGNIATLTIYNYDPREGNSNHIEIVKLIKSQKINVLWTDRGHSDFEIINKKLYEINSHFNTTADEIYNNDAIINALIANDVRQVAMYTFNATLTFRRVEEIKKKIYSHFQKHSHDVIVDVLETSAVFNFFGKDDWLSAGNEEDKFLGTTTAYKYYGNLLGNVLFDLFLQLPENKMMLSYNQRRYNFFNTENREFLRYYKLLNSDLTNKLSGFKIGMVSFFGEIFGKKEYLIDVPYKEYYENYDKKIEDGSPPIQYLIQPHPNSKKEEWLYFKYKKNENNEFEYNYTLCHSRNPFSNLVESYLPLLHTGLFYAPEFYNTGKFPTFSLNTDNCSYKKEHDCVEILYLLKNERFEDSENVPLLNQGVSHLVVWRWVDDSVNKITNRTDIEKEVEGLWERYYRLVEPKLKATLIGLFQGETKRLAVKAAETKILSRNFSHHIGSHVMPNVSLKQIKERYTELCGENISEEYLDYLKTKLDAYITERNEFLCDPDGSLKPVLFYSQIIVPFLENILLVDNLCHSEGLGFRKGRGCDIEIAVRIEDTPVYSFFDEAKYPDLQYNGLSGKDSNNSFQPVSALVIGNDLPVAVSNVHAFFSILENFIRNTAKHQKEKFEIDVTTQCLKEPLKIYLDLKSDEKDIHSFWLTISDNISVVSEGFERIDPQIIDYTNSVAQSNLGIIDFKICAGLLNKKPFEQVDKSIFRINRASADGRLSYSFKILKPKDICFIGYKKHESSYQPTFDYYATIDELFNAIRSPVPYQFYIIKEIELKKLTEKPAYIKSLPFRLLVEKSNSTQQNSAEYFEPAKHGRKYLLFDSIDLTKKADEILEQCWQLWLKRWGIEKKELIVFSEGNTPFENWNANTFESQILEFKYSYGTNTIQNISTHFPKLFYDHHGGGISNTNFPSTRSFLSSNSYIAFGKNSKDIATIRNLKPKKGEKWLLPFWLAEAGLAKILIIDERIFDIASKIYPHKKSKNTLIDFGGFGYGKYTNSFINWDNENRVIHNIDSYWASNIFVATDLNNMPVKTIKKSLFPENNDHWVKVNIENEIMSVDTNFDYLHFQQCEITDFTNRNSVTDFDVLIIHRTFLNDQSLKTYWGNITPTEVLKILNRLFPLVLITSGGGDVIHYEGDFKFISINEILSCISVPECIGKQTLANIIFTK